MLNIVWDFVFIAGKHMCKVVQVSFLTLSDGSDTVTYIRSVPARADEGLRARANDAGNYIWSLVYLVVYLLIGIQMKTNNNNA